MGIEEKMGLIKRILELNGESIMAKLEGNGEKYKEIFNEEKRLAKEVSKEGIFEFDFSSDEAFSKSMSEFCDKGCR